MNRGWLSKTLGEVCDVVNGGTPKTGVAEFWDGNHRWITPAEMGKRSTPYVGESARTLTDLGLANSSARSLPPYSVILSSRAPIGHLVINTQPMATNQGCKGLVPSGAIDHKFLYYYLSSIVDLLNDLGTGATFKELSGGKLKEISIPVPPILDQQRIVGILDEAFEAITTAKANTEKNLQNARALFESHLQSVFTQRGENWEERPFSELCDIKHGFAFKGEFFTNRGDHVVLTPGNFFETGGYRDRGEKQKFYCGEIPPDYILNEGDMLVAMTEQAAGLLGSPLLVPDSDKFLHNQRLGLVLPKPGVPWTNEFFFHAFNTSAVRKAIHDSASGVKVRHTSPSKIGTVVVAYPKSTKEQLAIVRVINQLLTETQRLAAIYTRKLAALGELKKSLLHQAFTGQLTADFRETVSIPFPAELPGISITDLHAGILAMAYRTHERGNKLDRLTKVKVEKISHMIEAWAGIELGRKPVKDYFGPNDTKHLKGVEHRAKMTKSFSFQKDGDGGERIRKLENFDALLAKTEAALGERQQAVEELLTLMLPMSYQQAEIFTTVHAAWNNLLLTGQEATDEAIVTEARENWHPEKRKIGRDKFFRAIEWIRERNLVPQGKGKLVKAKPGGK